MYIAIGHDEEVGGEKGAGAMAELLESRGIRFDHILDEGGSVLADGVAAITHTPVAVVGASEKASYNPTPPPPPCTHPRTRPHPCLGARLAKTSIHGKRILRQFWDAAERIVDSAEMKVANYEVRHSPTRWREPRSEGRADES